MIFIANTIGGESVDLRQWEEYITRAAANFAIDPALLASIIAIESRGDPFVQRYEPYWKYFYHPEAYARQLGITEETERRLQMFSYGLCQVIGSVLREHGWTSHLGKCLDAQINVAYGAMVLHGHITRNTTIEAAISSYNQGSAIVNNSGEFRNQRYVDDVMHIFNQLKKEKS